MIAHGYLYRIVARHADALELWPPAASRFAPETGQASAEAPVDAHRPRPPVAPAAKAAADVPAAPEERGRAAEEGSERVTANTARESRIAPRRNRGQPREVSITREAQQQEAQPDADFSNRPLDVRPHGSEPTRSGDAGDSWLEADSARRQPLRTERHRRSVTARRWQTADGDAAPDTVHVHIGRVEVRAVTTTERSAPAAPRAKGPQPLSLDDYLSRRSRR